MDKMSRVVNICKTDLQFVKKIGHGGFGTVNHVIWKSKSGNVDAAAKRLYELDRQEIEVLSTLHHPNIVKLIGVVTDEFDFMLILELCEEGSLRTYLSKDKDIPLPADQFDAWSKQAAKAIGYLQEMGIIHKDIKSDNFLITKDNVLKLADFGLAKKANVTLSKATGSGTAAYMAPELFTESMLSPTFDIFAFGVVIWEMITRQIPFEGNEYHWIVYHVCNDKMRLPIPPECPDHLADLMRRCWLEDRYQRPSIKEIISILDKNTEVQPSTSSSLPVSQQLDLQASATETKRPHHPGSMDASSDLKRTRYEDSKNHDIRTAPVFTPDELKQALMPTLEKLIRQNPGSRPFKPPVDPKMLHTPDYYNIVKHPIDILTIKRKLDTGQYTDPWQYIDDVWLMFDNAWLYNPKTSQTYKFYSKLAEVFEQEIDPVMQMLKYCCGRKYVFHPQMLCCYGKQLCTIPTDATYWSYQNRYHFCEKCFIDIEGDTVTLGDDQMQPQTTIKKETLTKMKNNVLDPEPFIECLECGRKVHQICVLHNETVWPEGFICDHCRTVKGISKKENKFTVKNLQTSKLGTHIEKRVNKFLRDHNAGAGEVIIRVLFSSEKTVEVKPRMRSRFGEEFPESFPYRAKAVFAFEEIDGTDVCFFGMYVQEYGSDCPQPNSKRVYFSWIDSVHFFQPKAFRTAVYYEITIGYLEYVKMLGYEWAHIWSCPPSELGNDYIFHCHPPEQKMPTPKKMLDWCKQMLDKAVNGKEIEGYKDILKYSMDSGFKCATELPYFEGDFWPNVLEESIKELDQEEKERLRAAETAALSQSTSEEVSPEGSSEVQKNDSNCSASMLMNKTPQQANDLLQKLYATMEKHRKVFIVVKLSENIGSNAPIDDPDSVVTSCDLMDGRDNFLTLARKNHYEFSSLRRAKFSTMAMLCEISHKWQQQQLQRRLQQAQLLRRRMATMTERAGTATQIPNQTVTPDSAAIGQM